MHYAHADRSIPACAGEPLAHYIPHIAQKVYPRVCGGTVSVDGGGGWYEGLSPRVRGNPGMPPPACQSGRSIPACAGEPPCVALSRGPGRVYPRVCGGTAAMASMAVVVAGLSPRVRGNHQPLPRCGSNRRSIPACAGEPLSVGGNFAGETVYPRVCGGTADTPSSGIPASGLSPRVRGNRAGVSNGTWGTRSIPACAGEPTSQRPAAVNQRVYPRVCGGTGIDGPLQGRRQGLSPRVRGNLHIAGKCLVRDGSIPACAGEPLVPILYGVLNGVYPRVCGGTNCSAVWK